MFTDPTVIYTLELATLAAIGILATAALYAWRGWLELRKLEFSPPAGEHRDSFPGTAGSRIEIADLKERIRKLEAIAAGVDL